MPSLSHFGPYRLECILKSGGMAVLFLATEELLPGVERPVVLKRISPENRGDEQFTTMFLDEVRLLSSLSHPSLPAILDAGMLDGEPYFVMEFIEGYSLAELFNFRRDILPQREALSIAFSLAETLAYIHGHHDKYGRPSRIVHRDLKPANVILSNTGAIKLIDFGIAHGANRIYQTATGVIKGTLGYMAPEMLIETQPLTHRTDIFGFGILLYELLVGAPPFSAPDPLRLHELIITGTFPSPNVVNPHVSSAMNRLITRCLSITPTARPDGMWEVATEIRDELTQLGGIALRNELAALFRQLGESVDQEAPTIAFQDALSSLEESTTKVDFNQPTKKSPQGAKKR